MLDTGSWMLDENGKGESETGYLILDFECNY